MMVRKLKTKLSRQVCILALAAVATSCIDEKAGDCDITRTLTVRAYDNTGTELTGSEVGDVKLYVFDTGRRFTRCIDTRLGQTVSVDSPYGEDIHIVGWGNLEGGNQTYPQPIGGEPQNSLQVSLLPDTRATAYAYPPDDLFLGEITIAASEGDGDKLLPVYRQMGSMVVTVRGLKAHAGYSDNDYRIEVHETPSAIDFYGNLTGTNAGYRPQGSFVTNNSREEYYVPVFNLTPEAAGVTIEIYHDTQLIASLSTGNGGTPIAVMKGELTNVLVDFGARVSVTVSLTGWGSEQVWKEF